MQQSIIVFFAADSKKRTTEQFTPRNREDVEEMISNFTIVHVFAVLAMTAVLAVEAISLVHL